MNERNTPPKWAVRFFQWFCNDHLSEAVLGDLTDLYNRRRPSIGKSRADILFIWNVIQFVQPFALRKKSPSLNPMTMYRNYLKVSWRNMTTQKMYALIKIGGFALGLATCMVIGLYIRHELSYDKGYKNAGNIYRVVNEVTGPEPAKWTAFPSPFAAMLKSDFPEIELVGRLIPYNWFNAGSNLVRRADRLENIYEERFAYADPELLQILEIPMVYGNTLTALAQPNSVVISRKIAEKYFPGEDPVGKVLVLNDEADTHYAVGGVMEDFDPTSHLQFDFFLTLAGKEFWPGEQTNWCCWNYNPYIRLKAGTDPAIFQEKMASIKKVLIDYLAAAKDQHLEEEKKYHRFILQRVGDIHLYSDGIDDIIPHGDIRYIWMFGGIAIFILGLACINFINLSTARSAGRAKEVGLRKVVGSRRGSLVTQFLSESVLYSLVSFLLAVGILWTTLPFFEQLAGVSITIPWKSWWFFPFLFASALLIGLVAGLYPSFYLSAFKPIDVIKGNIARGMKHATMRSAMVVFQFTTSIALIIGTFIIYKQMNFILTTKIGFDKDQVIMVQGINTLKDHMQTFKDELLTLSDVENVSISAYLPVAGTKRDQNSFWREGKSQQEKSVGAQIWEVDEDYISTLGMKLAAGRTFQKELASDSNAVIINEAMAKALGLANPLGERIQNWRVWHVIGVLKDFHFENMKGEIGPLCLVRSHFGTIAAVRVNTHNMHEAIQSISSTWQKLMPHQPIRYTFLDESYARMYDDVRRTGNIFASFAILAIIVACLGLFALSAFMVEQRTKEISVRKVLGASLRNIFRLLTQEFIKLVLISFALAVPLSWFTMQRWLEDYKYRVTLGWEVFLVAGILSVLIALMTVSYQTLRAGLANPAENLRSE